MTIFYRGPCVRITHKVFETRCPTYRAYPISDLHEVRVVERTADPPAAISSARAGSAGVAGAMAVAIALGYTGGWETLTMLGLVALLILSIGVSGACWCIGSTQHELVAVYRGDLVTLHHSPDSREFGQVSRALMRAIEQLGDTR